MSDSRAEIARSMRRLVCMVLTWMLRIAIVLNFVRFALSFIPRFEGTAQRAGIIDRLLGSSTVFFFRADFAWLLGSTMVIFLATLYFVRASKKDSRARLDAVLCQMWIVAFVVYLIKLLLTGVLYLG
jgi:hypothetical protein